MSTIYLCLTAIRVLSCVRGRISVTLEKNIKLSPDQYVSKLLLIFLTQVLDKMDHGYDIPLNAYT